MLAGSPVTGWSHGLEIEPARKTPASAPSGADRIGEALARLPTLSTAELRALTRSLADFARLIETFDAHAVSLVSVTQPFNTTSSMGRLTLNVLLSSRSSSAR